MSDNLQISHGQTNWKMRSPTKNLFLQSVLVADIEQTPFLLKSNLNINNFDVLPLLNKLGIKRNLVEKYFSLALSFSIRMFLALSNDQSFSCFD